MLNQAQIDHLSTLCYINKIDSHLNIVSGVRILPSGEPASRRVILLLEIFYDGDKINEVSFNLYNFGYEDIVSVVRNIRSNEFIMQEVDNFLAGEIE